LNLGLTGLSREEFLRRWGELGALRERRKWAEYWRSVELQVPLACREKILKAGVVLQRRVERGRLIERKARQYYHILLKLGMLSKGQMDNVRRWHAPLPKEKIRKIDIKSRRGFPRSGRGEVAW